MKVILLKDVKGVGRAHEEVVMSDGYALNYLIPKKLGVVATPATRAEAELRRRQNADRVEVDHALVAQAISSLAEARLVIKKKANEQGHLYDAVNEPEIRDVAREQIKVELPEGVVALEKPIKELGEFTIPLAWGDAFGSTTLVIETE